MKNRTRRGEYLIESALVLVPFIFTIVGVIDSAQILFFYQTLRERACAGARYAIVHTYDVQAVKNVVVYNAVTAPGSGKGFFGLTTAMVTVTRYDQGTSNDRIQVQISNYPIGFISPLLSSYRLQPVFRAVMPVESLGATD